jgi:hypothetical protein
MKTLQLIDIGTKLSDTDLEGTVDTLFQIPIDNTSTMTNVYDALVEEIEGDDFGMLALEKFISIQDEDSFNKNIYETEEIKLENDDDNQYYMIFHLFGIKNILNENKVD